MCFSFFPLITNAEILYIWRQNRRNTITVPWHRNWNTRKPQTNIRYRPSFKIRVRRLSQSNTIGRLKVNAGDTAEFAVCRILLKDMISNKLKYKPRCKNQVNRLLFSHNVLVITKSVPLSHDICRCRTFTWAHFKSENLIQNKCLPISNYINCSMHCRLPVLYNNQVINTTLAIYYIV